MASKKITIKGMHCASCAVNIEKALLKNASIKKANVNYALEQAFIDYDDTIECMHCRLEFDKYDIERFDRNQILSLQEKRAFFSIF